MLNARVRKFMAASGPGEDIAFVVHVKAVADLASIARIPDMLQRRAAIHSIYKQMKSSVVDALDAYAVDGLRVVNPLDGTPQLIAAGPASAWEKAMGEHAALFENPDIALIPNESMAFGLAAH